MLFVILDNQFNMLVLAVIPPDSADTTEQIQQKYSPEQVREWSYELRRFANSINDIPEFNELATHVYNVHYAIGPKVMSNIFSLDEDYLALPYSGGRTGLAESISYLRRTPLTGTGSRYIWTTLWNSGLGDYLKDLQGKLVN